MHSEYIPFTKLHQFNAIFADYCAQGNVTRFFSGHYSELLSGKADLSLKILYYSHRNELVQVLRKTNQKYKGGEKTFRNIEKIQSEKTFAVVTGQQMGLFSGPLYTIYKTIGAIKTAELLENKYPEYNFVPVFWLEQEDSDFPEINHSGIITKNNEYLNVIYEKSYKNEQNTPILEHLFTDNIQKSIKELSESLSETEFSENLIKNISGFYEKGKKINDAFAEWINFLFKDYGLIIFNPSDQNIKKLLSPVFKKAIQEAEKIHLIVQNHTKKLIENGYSEQVCTFPSYLHCLDKQNKLNFKKRDKFRLKTPFTDNDKTELLKLLEIKPEYFSPNVLLRPIAQDSMLPTIAYIAGPGETAYFAQITPLYEFFNIRQPYIIPRPSLTIVEKKIGSLLEKYQIKPEFVMQKGKVLKNELVFRFSEVRTAEKLQKGWEKITNELMNLRDSLISADPTLSGLLDTTVKKMGEVYKILQKKAGDAEKRKNSEVTNHAVKMLNFIFPEDDFQERKINILYFLNKYNFEFISLLHEQIEVNNPRHQVLYL